MTPCQPAASARKSWKYSAMRSESSFSASQSVGATSAFTSVAPVRPLMLATSTRQPSSAYGRCSHLRAVAWIRVRSSGERQFSFGSDLTPHHDS